MEVPWELSALESEHHKQEVSCPGRLACWPGWRDVVLVTKCATVKKNKIDDLSHPDPKAFSTTMVTTPRPPAANRPSNNWKPTESDMSLQLSYDQLIFEQRIKTIQWGVEAVFLVNRIGEAQYPCGKESIWTFHSHHVKKNEPVVDHKPQ